jgi:hypothetical protein
MKMDRAVEVYDVSERTAPYSDSETTQRFCCFLSFFLEPEDGSNTFFLNAGKFPADYTASHPMLNKIHKWYNE